MKKKQNSLGIVLIVETFLLVFLFALWKFFPTAVCEIDSPYARVEGVTDPSYVSSPILFGPFEGNLEFVARISYITPLPIDLADYSHEDLCVSIGDMVEAGTVIAQNDERTLQADTAGFVFQMDDNKISVVPYTSVFLTWNIGIEDFPKFSKERQISFFLNGELVQTPISEVISDPENLSYQIIVSDLPQKGVYFKGEVISVHQACLSPSSMFVPSVYLESTVENSVISILVLDPTKETGNLLEISVTIGRSNAYFTEIISDELELYFQIIKP